MSHPPRVSVCIATYNQAPYIEDCILSVLAQGGDAELEVLVGDDASTDGTGEIVERLARRHPALVVPRRSGNLGATGNYRDLVERASGDFIAHLDGDDAWLPGKLRAQLAFLQAHPDCIAAYTNALVVDVAGHPLGPFTNSHPARISLPYLCARGNFLMHSTTLYRAAGKKDFFALPPPLIDYAVHLAFAKHAPLGFIDQPLALYRFDTSTSMVRNSFPWVQRQLWTALKDAAKALPERDRRRSMAYFAGNALIARAVGKTDSAWPLIREAADEAGASPAALLIAAIPMLVSVYGHGRVRSWLRRIGALPLMAQHYRV